MSLTGACKTASFGHHLPCQHDRVTPPPVCIPKEGMNSDASHAHGMPLCFGRQFQVHMAQHQRRQGRAER